MKHNSVFTDFDHLNDEEKWTDEEKNIVENASSEFMFRMSDEYFKNFDPEKRLIHAAKEYAADDGCDTSDIDQVLALEARVREKTESLEKQIAYDRKTGNEQALSVHEKMYKDISDISFGMIGILFEEIF